MLFPFLDAIPVFFNLIPVLETLDIIPDRLLDLFRYYSLDTVPGPHA